MKFKNQIKLLENSLKKLLENEAVEQNINSSIKLFCSAIKSGLPILVFGNGGSASDALHITENLLEDF